jgi:hypothetical protein
LCVRKRRRILFLLAWSTLATLTLDLAACNDGSTGCCMVCADCACGNSCVSCSTKCTLPKGCACSSSTGLTAAAVTPALEEPMSMEPMSMPDAGPR